MDVSNRDKWKAKLQVVVRPFGYAASLAVLLLGYQNCSNSMSFESDVASVIESADGASDPTEPPVEIAPPGAQPTPPPVEICMGVSCSLDPLTTIPAVTTILLALGDENNNLLVGNPVSNQLLAESVIRFSSPMKDPKILIVRDEKIYGEDPEDTLYIEKLLSRYKYVTFKVEGRNGLRPVDVESYDLVWFNNPGHEMTHETTYKTLLGFKGAVILQGDDLSRGNGFSMTALTGLKYIDNGEEVVCGGESFLHDNNGGRQYTVTLDPKRIVGVDKSTVSFKYGNDIDNTEIALPGVEVLATAVGGDAKCVETRPTIVRRVKPVKTPMPAPGSP